MASSPITDDSMMSSSDHGATEKNVVRTSSSHVGHEKAGFDKRLLLKVDLHILTPMFFLNFLSLMGRTNIGAALIQGLPKDLKLNAIKIFLAITISLIPLILFEIPSNLLMRLLERKYNFSYMRYLSAITVFLGVVTLGQAFDQTYSALLGTRFVVGIFDAGLIPGCVYVCSLYYPAVHLQWRMTMLMVANICSNIISNILAFAIAHIHSSNGYHGWRWIFIVEGCLTIAIGLICCLSKIGRPSQASFLSPSEKETVEREVEVRSTSIGIAAEWKIFFSNGLNYVWAACYVLTCSTTYSTALFAPSFVSAFHPHYTIPQVQGQVVPIFVVSAAAALLVAFLADRFRHRAGFAIFGYLITMIGFIILRQAHITSAEVAMLGLYFVSIGTFTSLPILWNLTLVNLPSPFQKAIGCGFVVGIGNVGGFASSWLFRTSEAPHYHKGMTDSLIMTIVSMVLVAGAWGYIAWSNRRKDLEGGVGQNGQVRRYTA